MNGSAAADLKARRRKFIESLRDKPVAFNSAVLGRGELWARQKEIARSVVKYPVTLVPTGNMVGKTHLAASLIHWFLFTRPGCIVLVTAPSQTQLSEVLWSSVEKAYRGASLDLGGRLLRSPLKVDLGNGWHALAYSTTDVERLSGHHAPELFAVIDEASGVSNAVFEALRSCGPSRELLIGNPLRSTGVFYDRCQNAKDNPLANVVHVDSREGPHIDLDRSPWGLADRGWLQSVINDYGPDSLWFRCHVRGLFPDENFDGVFTRAWIEAAFATVHVPAGPMRTSIDLGLGNGGDQSVIITRDDNGVLACEASNTWSLEVTATKAADQVKRFGVSGHNVTWDVAGIGADFDNRLRGVGIKDAQPFWAGGAGGKRFTNLRSAAAWGARQRLDPGFLATTPNGLKVKQRPFSLQRVTGDSAVRLKKDLQELRYDLGPKGEIRLETAEDYAGRLKRSPDHGACFFQLWAFDDPPEADDPPATAAAGVAWPWL